MVAVALRTPLDAAPAELAEAIAGQQARGDLDPELQDDEGYPIMSTRADDPISPDERDDIAQWFAAQGMSAPRLADEQWRTLGMATRVAAELAQHAARHRSAVLVRPQALQS